MARLAYTTSTPTPAEVAHRRLNPTVRQHVAPSRRSLLRMSMVGRSVCTSDCVLHGMPHDRCDWGQ
jgi:hypothetical protein